MGAAKKYKLDAPSACKLAEVLESRNDADSDLRKVCTHLDRSNKPSALIMMMLKDLKAGNVIDEATKAPAIGSYLHKEENRKAAQKRSRSRHCGSKIRQQRVRSPSRHRSGSRSRREKNKSMSRRRRSKSR